ncbi:hypothetical protein ACNOYE_13115 [Nannocystaceae bacterium ST9]
MLIIPTLAILAWWLWPPSPEVRELDEPSAAQTSDELAPLPTYALATESDVGSPSGPSEPVSSDGKPNKSANARLVYRLDSAFDWQLAPASEVAGELALRAFVFPEAPTIGDARELALGELASVEPRGLARVHGSIRQLALDPGRYTIALVVGRPGSLPAQAEAVHAGTGTEAWTVRRVAIEIE